MAGRPSRRDSNSTHEPQAASGGMYPGYFDGENTSVAPMVHYADTFDNICTSPIFAGDDNYNNTPLPYNIWPAEIAVAQGHGMPFAGAITSPTVPTHAHYMPLQLPTPLTETVPMASDEWQIQVTSLVQTSPGTPWSYGTQTALESIHNPTSARSSEAGLLYYFQHYDTANISLSNATTHLNRSGDLSNSLPASLPRRRSTPVSRAAGTNEATNFESNAPRPAIGPTYEAGRAQPLISPISQAGSSTAGTDDQARPTRPGGLRRASFSVDTQQQDLQPPLPTPIPEPRARNRAAANKCRAKNKAAAAELESTEKAESLRREQLLATFRALQAEVFVLKSEILLHGGCSDGIIQSYLNNTAGSFVTDGGGGGGGGGAAQWAPDDGPSFPDSRYMQSPP